MVFTGRPSAGCENCRYADISEHGECTLYSHASRRAKKHCDGGLPACSRCVRTNKTCGGYRNVNDLLFRDEGPGISRRSSSSAVSPTSVPRSRSSRRSGSPQTSDETAIAFFFDRLVTDAHLAFLRAITISSYLRTPILACAYAAMGTRSRDRYIKELARRLYGNALSAAQTAIQDARRAREDEVLISVLLLGLFEVRDP